MPVHCTSTEPELQEKIHCGESFFGERGSSMATWSHGRSHTSSEISHAGLVFGDVLLFSLHCYRESSAARKAGFNHIMAKSEKSFQLKILYGEGDAEVVASQAVSIQKAGHQVETAVGRKGIDQAVRRETFDLVILGPTLTRNDRHHLPYVIKKTQSTRVLVMHTDGERHPAVDANTDTGRSMADVVAKIASLMTSSEIASSGMAKGAAAGR
jgi:hypothetical protein